MTSKGIFTCAAGSLLPADNRARDIVGKLKFGQKVLMEVDTARYPDHHRLAFAVFQIIADATGRPVEDVYTYLKARTGYVDYLELLDGKVVCIPRSIKFSAMNQDQFQRWWDAALIVISEKILPDLPEHEYAKIRELIAGRAEAA